MSKPCNCGSKHPRYELRDAAGTFVAFVCDKCEQSVRNKYNPNIFVPATVYASTGEEEDIGRRFWWQED